MIPTFSIIIPTFGRPTICNTIVSLRGQLRPGDEIIVEVDEPPTGNWGAVPRDRGIARATGSHLLFMDDDDVYTSDALFLIRDRVALLPDALHMFQALWMNQGAAGQEKHNKHEFSGGQCPTPTIIVPRAVAPKWTPIGGNVHQDLEYAKLCAQATYPHIPQWHDIVIAKVRPIRDDDPYVKWDGWLMNARPRRRPM
jgi:glycosyltransferase involved in cell wall biosynthesis